MIIFFLPFCSDITTLTSASYPSSLPMHAGQHLLSIQGTFLTNVRPTSLDCCQPRELCYFLSQEALWATAVLELCLETAANSCFQLQWFLWVTFWTVKAIQLLCIIKCTKSSGSGLEIRLKNIKSVVSGSSLPDAWVQLSFSRPRTVQRRSGSPRALRGRSGSAPLHICPRTVGTC